MRNWTGQSRTNRGRRSGAAVTIGPLIISVTAIGRAPRCCIGVRPSAHARGRVAERRKVPDRQPIYTRARTRCRHPIMSRSPSSAWPISALRFRRRRRQEACQAIPDHPDLGASVESRAAAEENPSNRWLAELQQDIVLPRSTHRTPASAASRTAAGPGLRSGKRLEDAVSRRWSPKGRQGSRSAIPFAGLVPGVDQRGKYPKGNDPIVLGESVNTLTSYGYDPVTGSTRARYPVPDPSGVRGNRSWLASNSL